MILYIQAVTTCTSFFPVSPPGDSYVAVTRIPNPQPTHAVTIFRFAWDCLVKFNDIFKEVELVIHHPVQVIMFLCFNVSICQPHIYNFNLQGPDTGDLQNAKG
jgi:hypothetical protein